jgi:cation:H+ antiporter
MLSPTLTFIIGFALLLKGADVLTDAASSLAKKLGVATFIIGVVVVGIGTSIPELIITVFSNLQGFEEVGIGTVVGSNTLNILLILGVASLVRPLALKKGQVWRHLPLNTLAVVLVGALIILSGDFFGLTQLAGIFLLCVFLGWLAYLNFVNKYILAEEDEALKTKIRSNFKNTALIIGGLVAVVVGGEWVTQSSITIARGWGVSEAVIGLTIVSLGSSLPELMASVVAAFKGNHGIAVGNVVGSNIFDFLMIFGLAAAMKPIPFTPLLFADLLITGAASVFLFIIVFTGAKYRINRPEGIMLISLYILYLLYVFAVR